METTITERRAANTDAARSSDIATFNELSAPDMGAAPARTTGQAALAAQLNAGTLSQAAAEIVLREISHLPASALLSTASQVTATIDKALTAAEKPAPTGSTMTFDSAMTSLQSALGFLVSGQTLERIGLGAACRAAETLMTMVFSRESAPTARSPEKGSFDMAAGSVDYSASDYSGLGTGSQADGFHRVTATDLLKSIFSTDSKHEVHQALMRFVEALERAEVEKERKHEENLDERDEHIRDMARELVRIIDAANGRADPGVDIALNSMEGAFGLDPLTVVAQVRIGEQKRLAEQSRSADRTETFKDKERKERLEDVISRTQPG